MAGNVLDLALSAVPTICLNILTIHAQDDIEVNNPLSLTSTWIETGQNGRIFLLFDLKHTFDVSVIKIKNISNHFSVAEF